MILYKANSTKNLAVIILSKFWFKKTFQNHFWLLETFRKKQYPF